MKKKKQKQNKTKTDKQIFYAKLKVRFLAVYSSYHCHCFIVLGLS